MHTNTPCIQMESKAKSLKKLKEPTFILATLSANKILTKRAIYRPDK